MLGNLQAAKTCATSCSPTNTQTILGTGGGVKCCNTDRCNFSNVSLKIKAEILILIFSAFLAIFYNLM